jgi:hypothetical protein
MVQSIPRKRMSFCSSLDRLPAKRRLRRGHGAGTKEEPPQGRVRHRKTGVIDRWKARVTGYFEYLLPVTGNPGVKLGLANTVLLYALYPSMCQAAPLMFSRWTQRLALRRPAAMLYSFAGGALSHFIMIT